MNKLEVLKDIIKVTRRIKVTPAKIVEFVLCSVILALAINISMHTHIDSMIRVLDILSIKVSEEVDVINVY